MAPKRGTKRAAPVVEDTPAKRLATTLTSCGTSPASYKAFCEAIEHPLNEINDECRAMLLAILPSSLCVASDERHEFQQSAVEMYAELLKTLEEKLETELALEKDKVAGHETSKGGLEGALQEATEALAAAQSTTADKLAVLTTATEALAAAKSALTKRQSEQKKGDAGIIKVQKEKGVLEALREGPVKTLLDGEVEAAQATKLYKKEIIPILAQLDVPDSMKQALPTCLAKKPDVRGPFDKIVQDSFVQCFSTKLENLQAQIDSASAQAEERAAAVTAATEAVAAAEGVLAQAQEKLTEAQEAEKKAEEQQQTALQRLEEYDPEYKAATQLRDDKEAYLSTFQSIVLPTFLKLKDRTTLKAEEPEAKSADAEMESKPAEEPIEPVLEAV